MKNKKNNNQTQEQSRSDKDLLSSFLNENKKDHFNFIDEKYFKISSGSLLLDSVLDGGFTPGLHRFVGFTSGGKTSEAMQVLNNFLNTIEGSKGIYFSAEGRLNENVKNRSGLKFVNKPEEWDEGTVFVYESNVYESVAGFIELLINGDSSTQYGIIVDSIDGLSLKSDLGKGFDESAKVAGGPVVASVLMKRISIPLAKKGHLAIFISQVRSEVVLDPYSPKPIRQITSTGGNALLHYANIILQFEPRFKNDMICTNEKEPPSSSNPLLGHWAKVIIKKSSNDKNNYVIKYPVKYGDNGESKIWREKEVVDCLLQWEDLEKKGAWYNFSSEFIELGIVPEQKFQGLDSVYSFFASNKDITEKVYNYLTNSICGSNNQQEES